MVDNIVLSVVLSNRMPQYNRHLAVACAWAPACVMAKADISRGGRLCTVTWLCPISDGQRKLEGQEHAQQRVNCSTSPTTQ